VRSLLTTLALVLCAGLALAQTGAITGQVVDAATGNPLAGAVAFAKSDSGLAGQARTNERGVYVIEGLAAGRYDVGAVARGYETGHYPERVGVRAGQTTPDINMRLRPNVQNLGAISGRVTDRATGSPVPGAVVVAKGPAGRGKARTDRHGNYVIRGLPEGRYEVGVKAKLYKPEVFPRPVPVQSGQVTENVDFALVHRPRKGAIAGQVIDARTREPIPGATVVARGEEGSFRAVTDRHGFYRMRLPAGRYHVGAAKRGYQPEAFPRPVPVRPGEVTRDVNFALHRLNADSD
jgi:protocatechuate 3,4-dioxygenase beta subunit